jgi:hypothetical protein
MTKRNEDARTVGRIREHKGVRVGKVDPQKVKQASYATGNTTLGLGGNVYSPEWSTDYLELPRTDADKWRFFRFFYDHDPFVGQAIDLLSELPLSKVRLRKPKARNKKIAAASLRFCERWANKINLLHRLMEIVHEWNLLGEAHIFCEDATPEMPQDVTHEARQVVLSTGEVIDQWVLREDSQERTVAWLRKNYKGWTAIRLLPPEQVNVESFPFTDEKIAEMIPDSKTKQLVDRVRAGDRNAARVLDSMPADIVEALLGGNTIPLNMDPDAGSFYYCLARKKSQYENEGKSILQRCIRTLVFRDKVRQSLTSIASRHMTPYRLIYAEDMSEEQTDLLREQVDLALQDPDYSIITNFQVTWEEMGADQRLPDWSWVWDLTDRQMYAGLTMTESLLSGEASYSGDRIHLEVLNTRFMLLREVLQNLVEERFFRPMCARMGFVEEDEDGNLEVIVPALSFTRLSFRDNTETFDALFNLYQKGSLDVATILEHLNLDVDAVRERLERDFGTVNDSQFNELLRGLYGRMGDLLAEGTDFAEILAQRLGLKYAPPKEEGGGRF